jgi:hypothetical protein
VPPSTTAATTNACESFREGITFIDIFSLCKGERVTVNVENGPVRATGGCYLA